MNIYVVRNREGHFFRAKGFGGSGKSWVEDLGKARFYTKIGQAKSRVTFFTREYPQYGVPDVLVFELNIENAQVMDMTEATTKSIAAKKVRQLKRERAWKDSQIKVLESQRSDIEQKIFVLKPN